MPWKVCKPMDERLKFIARLLDGEKMAVACRDFGISRKTGYKILTRYNEIGLDGLTDRSRRPYRRSMGTSGRGPERVGHKAADRTDADVPGNVAPQFGFRNAEPTESARQAIACKICHDQTATHRFRWTRDRLRIIGRQEALRHPVHRRSPSSNQRSDGTGTKRFLALQCRFSPSGTSRRIAIGNLSLSASTG
jgi:hypothetical protein